MTENEQSDMKPVQLIDATLSDRRKYKLAKLDRRISHKEFKYRYELDTVRECKTDPQLNAFKNRNKYKNVKLGLVILGSSVLSLIGGITVALEFFRGFIGGL